jgi:hypothetical protein
VKFYIGHLTKFVNTWNFGAKIYQHILVLVEVKQWTSCQELCVSGCIWGETNMYHSEKGF